ncbi:hypothetical protein VNO80_00381 [Phaseolus coccineus]|uniref:ADP-ribosyl cyclase/cyclic ADP-ribose hydrolase n=1 Tax=Phaseolus coccineus TaxID=3886 RepID=A0AAN9P5C0_PHACN
MPIFYEVDPSDVRHQRRTYGDAFVKHERNYSSTTVQSWRSALSESANLSGFYSSIFHDTLQSKYDVFISFRGPDVREGFLSHLIEALSLNQIASFVDYNIPKGHQISDVLLRAIEYNLITVQTWRIALKESANLVGFDSSTFRNDAKLVKEIVKCVSSMVLNIRHKVNSKEQYEIEVPYSYAATDEGYAEVFSSSEGICEHQERSLRERFWQCKSKEM